MILSNLGLGMIVDARWDGLNISITSNFHTYD